MGVGEKIKLAMVAASFSINGISTVIMNYCRHMNLEQFDITIMAGAPVDSSYKKECEQIGIRMVELPSKKQMPKRFYKALWKQFSGGYDIAHIHGNSRVIAVELFLAYIRGIHIRIAHCHSTTCDHIQVHKLLRPIFNFLYTEGFACSSIAGEWIFGNKKFLVMPNGFNVTKYRFEDKVRFETRKELAVENKFLIGHVGRFNKSKNQEFILAVFEKVAENNPDAYLILVGEGPDFEKIKYLIQEHTYSKRIIVYGETTEPEKLYAAMDVFLFPSRYEGLGIALLEAQISGLPCIASDVMPTEVLLGGQVQLLSLDEDITFWINAVLRSRAYNRELFYEQHIEKINKYNIFENVYNLEKFYHIFIEKYGEKDNASK